MPAGRPVTLGTSVTGLRSTTRTPTTMPASAPTPTRPSQPGRNRPVGKISSRAAMPRGRTAPNRSRNHRDRLAPR
jgi:hypothetical protein